MNTPDPGPDPRVFQHLAGRMGSFGKEATAGKIITPGKKMPCPICGRAFGGVFKPQTKQYCRACRKALADGFCCFRTLTGRHTFFKAPGMPADWAGTVRPQPLTDEQMDEMEKRFAEMNKPDADDKPQLN